MKPDYDAMSKAELRAYVIAHREDREAFYKLVDRFKADSKNQIRHPFPKSLEDITKVRDLVQEHIQQQEKS